MDHRFVKRLGKRDYTMAIINIEENYTKSHFDESVDILIVHYREVLLTFRVDAVVAQVGKLATDPLWSQQPVVSAQEPEGVFTIAFFSLAGRAYEGCFGGRKGDDDLGPQTPQTHRNPNVYNP